MGSAIMSGWLSIDSLAWSLLRIALIWLAFHGAGSLASRIRFAGKHFSLMPSIISGMLIYIALISLLSLFHVLTRNVVAVFILAGASAGLVFLYISLKKFIPRFHFSIRNSLAILPFLLAGYILLTNLMLAGRPEMNFNDTQVTYLVQPDRWLDDARMSFIEETRFSAYPLTSEMLLILPSSLSIDRVDQMILGQLFEISMILVLILISMAMLNFGWKWYAPALISILGCSTILLWCHFAKPDATALLFVTVSLVILLKQTISRDDQIKDYSAFLVMGLALTSKFTVYLTLIPFFLMLYILLRDSSTRKPVIKGLFVLVLLPLIFAIRTVIHTGTPFYPHAPLKFLLNSQWRVPDIQLTYAVFNDRSSHFYPTIGFLQNIWHYFGTWNSSLFLLISGFVLALKRNLLKRRFIILIGIGLYSVLSIILFYPSWWGAKYGILLIPFAAIFGLQMLRRLKYGLILATVLTVSIYFVYDTSISPTEHYGITFRNRLINSYISKEWTASGLQMIEKQPELEATLWMNHYAPPGSSILSFYATKRYFSDHRWIIAWRHPPAMKLYLENSISDEISILQDLSIDYVIIENINPAPFDDENSIELFSRIGRGDVLDPVAFIDGHTVLRFCPDNL